jgi:hypothetical protein
MKQEPIISLAEVWNDLNTFYIINCEGYGFWKYIGHTAMLYRDIKTGILYVTESTQRGGTNGVQITPFIDWIIGYPGKVWIRKIIITDKEARENAYKVAKLCIECYLGTPYTDPTKKQGFKMLLRSVWDSRRFVKASTNIDTDDWFFCTMWVLHLFRDCHLVKECINPAEWEPDNTRSDHKQAKLDKYVLRSYVLIGPDTRIK